MVDPNNLVDPVLPRLPTYGVHIVQEGESIMSIAKDCFGDAGEGAEAIAIVNDLLVTQPLAASSVIILPPYVLNHLKGDTSYPHQQFMSIIQGSLLPYLPLPKIDPPKQKKAHHHWWKDVVKMIVLAVALYFAPLLAGQLLGLMGFTASTGLAVGIANGVMAGLLDAAAQGVAVKTGLQDHFSMLEAVEMGVTMGMAKGMGVGLAKGQSFPTQAKMIMKTGMISVSAQLTEMKLGLRKQFDVQAVMTQMAAIVVAEKLDQVTGTHEYQAPEQAGKLTGRVANGVSAGAKSIATEYLGMKLHHVPVNVEGLATQALGAVAQDGVGEHFNEKFGEHGGVKKQDYAKSRNQAKEPSVLPSHSHHAARAPTSTHDQSGQSTAKIKSQLAKKGRPNATLQKLGDAADYINGFGDSLAGAIIDVAGAVIHPKEVLAGLSGLVADVAKTTLGIDRDSQSAARLGGLKESVGQHFSKISEAFSGGTTHDKGASIFNAISDATIVLGSAQLVAKLPKAYAASSQFFKTVGHQAQKQIKNLDRIYQAGKKIPKAPLESVNSSAEFMQSEARLNLIKHANMRAAALREKFGKFSRHSINRIIERGITPSALLDTFRNPLDVSPMKFDEAGRAGQVMIGKYATIVINPENRSIVTLYPTKSRIYRKLMRKLDRNNDFKPN